MSLKIAVLTHNKHFPTTQHNIALVLFSVLFSVSSTRLGLCPNFIPHGTNIRETKGHLHGTTEERACHDHGGKEHRGGAVVFWSEKQGAPPREWWRRSSQLSFHDPTCSKWLLFWSLTLGPPTHSPSKVL